MHIHICRRTATSALTHMEWECACRRGAKPSRFMGDGKQLLERYAWFIKNSNDHACPVGQLKPNNFGLFDMLRNVTERCFDRFGPYVDGAEEAEMLKSNDGERCLLAGSKASLRC